MKQIAVLQDLWFTNDNYKWYSLGNFKEGTNRVYRWVKDFKTNTFKQRVMYVYCFNGVLVPNTFTQRFDSCKFRFDSILKAKGDISKVCFECEYKLEVF
jgi:hypothetical protein